MSKAEQIVQKRSQRFQEGKFGCDWEGFLEYLDAVAEAALAEKTKRENEQANSNRNPLLLSRPHDPPSTLYLS